MADWVIQRLDDAALEAERQYYTGDYIDESNEFPDIPASEILAAMERDAVGEAERGNFKPLAELIHPENPMNRYGLFGRRIRESLAPRTWMLIVEYLTDQWRRKNGRPRLTEDERRAVNPIHDAADEFPAIAAILREAYPEQGTAEIRDRAMYVIAQRHGVEVNTLDNYLNRSERDHRRPANHPRPRSR